MTRIVHDPLLTTAKALLWFLMGAMALVVAVCGLALPIVVFSQDRIAVELAAQGLTVPVGDFVGGLIVVLACAAVLAGLLAWILRLLKQVIDTVGEGDPFVPRNADRLTRMAWLSVAVQAVTVPLALIGLWLTEAFGTDSDAVAVEPVSLNGLLLMLVLFILARVFRKGAGMRADLEGTV